MCSHPDKSNSAGKKRAPATRLQRIRNALYACTAVFFLGAFIWGAVLLKQGTVAPEASVPGAQAVNQVTETAVPLAQPKTNAASLKKSAEDPEQTQATGDLTVECTLSIPSLSLELPVKAFCTDEALLSSVCKFSGPHPGQEGNYVIVGHDFVSGAQFARLDRMQKGDTVVLTDKNKQAYTYTVYAMELVTPENTQALEVPAGNREATLLTCAEENAKRLLVRCRLE
ncbi:MAG: sortase [Bacillota bacterium]